ncbi:hypothetical protein [Burkholderia ubonensis]|uniref:hypothetical protein n=1 Tax=Burkholderia ubonensis TaxID=101571 RepID=UPI000AC07549|nr:hypothetical protein [Burkholderia ubonensis]
MFRRITSIPVLGFLLRIANTYAYSGDYAASSKFAGIGRWGKAFGPPLFFSVLLTTGTIWPELMRALHCRELNFSHASDFIQKPGALIGSTMPSLLGFGIGVYALIFGLAEPFVKQFKELITKERQSGALSHGSELMLNSDLAFPLIVLVTSLAIGTIQQAHQGNPTLIIATWIFFWYSLISMIEMISVIFRLAENSLLDKGKNQEKSTESKEELE